MEQNNSIFINIVENMHSTGHLSTEDKDKLKIAYSNYVDDLINSSKASKPKVNNINNPIQSNANNSNYTNNVYIRKTEKPHEKTKEEVRERNITWILNIGVFLILLSGVVFGTTTWGIMNNIGRAILLCSVSVIFFLISIIAKSVIKIHKSANAFWIMGSLFFPISLLSIGFFRVFGTYYSLWGNGRYTYGLICSLICLPVYIWSTYRNKSRTFSWITLINVTLAFSFAVLSLKPSASVFSLLILLLNGLYLAASIFRERTKRLSIFLNELPVFIQFNLILSTAIVLFTLDNTYLYSINLILASALFLAFSFTHEVRKYDYVFGILFSFGMFMLSRAIGNSVSLYILIPVTCYIFTGLSLTIGREYLKRASFNILSGISSIIGFTYITATMFMSSKAYDSYLGLVALLLLTINYFYLTYKSSDHSLGLLIPVQIIAIIYEVADILKRQFNFKYNIEFLLITTVILFIFGYLLNKSKTFRYVRFSSLACTLVNTFAIFIIGIINKPLLFSLPIICLVFTAQLYIAARKLNDVVVRQLLYYISTALLFASFCLVKYSYRITYLDYDVFAFFSALAIFTLHFICLKWFTELKKPFFYIGQFFLTFTMLIVLIIDRNNLLYTIMFFIIEAVYIYSSSVTKTKEKYLWLYVALINSTLLIYKVMNLINISYNIDYTKYSLYIGAFILVGICFILNNINLKKHVAFYLCFLTLIMIFGNIFTGTFALYEYIAEIIFAGLLCICLYKSTLKNFIFSPLLLVLTANNLLVDIIFKRNVLSVLVIILWFTVLVLIGYRKERFVFDSKEKSIGFFTLFALFSILNTRFSYSHFELTWLISIIPGLMTAIWLFVQRKRLIDIKDSNKLGNCLFSISLLWPYFSFLDALQISNFEFKFELILLPFIILTYINVKWIFRGIKNGLVYTVEYLIPSTVYIILLIRLFDSQDISHSLILGATGFISILYSMIFKTRSALVLGGAVIITDAIIQTKSFWTNIQWWIYLLILGSLLIIIASYNEYQKNKKNKGVRTKISLFLNKFSDWN